MTDDAPPALYLLTTDYCLLPSVAGAAQRAPGVNGRAAAFVNFELPVDDDVGDAFWILVGLLEGGAVADARGVEDGDVGEGAFAQHAAVAEPDARGGPPRHLVDGLLQRQQALLPHVAR